MSNFKSGSGNLDFGGDDGDEKEDSGAEETTRTEMEENIESAPENPPESSSNEEPRSNTETSGSAAAQDSIMKGETATRREQYPYFIRRNNIGDERDTRLEIHVRDKVADQEATFRGELAAQLGVGEISKTDAREFALLTAYQHPDRVAELMQDEGFGALD